MRDKTKEQLFEELDELRKRIKDLEKEKIDSEWVRQQLKHSRDLTANIISHSRSCIAVHDRNMNYLYVSDRYLRDYKVQEKNVIGKHHYDVFPDLPQKWRDVHKRVLSGEVLSAEEDPYFRKDGSVDWTSWECRPWYEVDGSIGGLIVNTEVINDRKNIEDDLRNRNEFIETLINLSPDIIYIYDLVTKKNIYSNNGIKNVLGYSQSEIQEIGDKLIPLLMHPDDLKVYVKETVPRYAKAEDKERISHLYRMQHKNGNWHWFESFELIYKRQPDGSPQQIFGVVHDITEYKKAEEELHRFVHIVSSSKDMMALLDKNFIYLAANDAYKNAFGMTSDEIVGQSVAEILGQEFFEKGIKPYAERCLAGEEVTYQDWFKFPATGKRYMDINYYPYLNDKNEVFGFVVTGRDITERKQAQIVQLTLKSNLESLWNLVKLQDKDLKTVADFVLDEISKMSSSKYGFYGFMSKDECFMHVYSWSTTVMKDCSIHHEHLTFEIKKAGIWADAVRKRKNILINNYNESFEGKKGIPEGHVSLTRILSVPVFSQNKIVAVAAVANKNSDYTASDLEQLSSFLTSAHLIIERKQVEIERERLHKELKLKNKELEQMLYVTSHDLRSPLVNVEGYGKELEYSLKDLMSSIDNVDVPLSSENKITSILNEDIPESLYYIRTSVSKMNTLLNGILTLSRLGRSSLSIKDIDMNAMMTDIIDSHRYRLNELNIKTDKSNFPNCKGDSSQINQVFSNLLDNAIKYTDSERHGVIHISGYKDKDQSVYCIKDNGIGIAPEHQDKIFRIFHQLEPDRFKGEGMGLTISHRIIEKHDGKIWVESELGKGSKFFVSLPS